MRSHAVCRCRGRRPRRPAEVSCGGRYAGGMNFSPTGYLLAGVGRKVADERGEGGRQPAPLQCAEVARERVATHSPSESPSHLTVTAPFDKGAFSPAGVRGNTRILKRSRGRGR